MIIETFEDKLAREVAQESIDHWDSLSGWGKFFHVCSLLLATIVLLVLTPVVFFGFIFIVGTALHWGWILACLIFGMDGGK